MSDHESNEKKKKEIALFRYSLISPVLVGNVTIQTDYFKEMAQKQHDVPYLGKKRYQPDTFKKWLTMYRRGGFEALQPKERNDKGRSRKINSDLIQHIKTALAAFPFLPGSALYRLLLSEGSIQPWGDQ